MSTDKQTENQEKASELEAEQLDQVVGGRKAIFGKLGPKTGGAGIIEDPCAGGE